MEKVKLQVNEWYWTCPDCQEGNFQSNDDFYIDGSAKDITCDECGNVFRPTF